MTTSRWIGFASFLVSTLALTGCGDDVPKVDLKTERAIEQGVIVGTTIEDGRVHVWRGLPFAAAPVGDLRWRAPVAPPVWRGTREALVSGSECAQLGGEPVLGSEDCLYLDVYAPTAFAGEETEIDGDADSEMDAEATAGGEVEVADGEAAEAEAEAEAKSEDEDEDEGAAGAESEADLAEHAPEPSSAAEAETQEVEASTGLPVMFWIHGGGNSLGAGSQIPPQALARDNGVIVVTINYRLGIFGWLSHPFLRESAGGPEDASGNFGTLDMIRALEWVRDNIAVFGGDPNRVTIFGESAGGVNVFSLLVSPRAKGLFQAAISESGSPTTMTFDEAENYTDEPDAPGLPGSSSELLIALLRDAGRGADRASAKAAAEEMTLAEIEEFMRSHSTEEILAPFAALVDGPMPLYITPNIFQDGHVISKGEPIDLFRTPGGYNAVPFIAGTNREESKLFFAMSSPHLKTTFGMPSGFKSERLYDVEGEYGGMIWRAMGADEPISAMRKIQGPTVWAYRFDWDEESSILGMDLSKLIGAAHAIEMLFVFDLTDLGFANRFVFEDVPSAKRLSEQMRSYWANFAHTHRPGRGLAGDLPEWRPWGKGTSDPKYLILDSDRDGGLEVGYDRIDQAFVLDRAAKDPRLFNDEERCRVLRNFVQWSEALSVEEYAAWGDGRCSEWPLESRIFFPSLSHQNENWADEQSDESSATGSDA